MLEVLGHACQHEHHYGTVANLLVLRSTQYMAIAFNMGVLVIAGALMMVTDLAFGWSSTVLSPTSMQRVVDFLAFFWAWALPNAVPDEELVEISRNYRMSMGLERVDATTAERLGGWWQFMLLCMLFWGLLPRFVTLAVAHCKLLAAIRGALEQLDGAQNVLNRLNCKDVETQGAREDTKFHPGAAEMFNSGSDATRADGASADINQSDVSTHIKTQTDEECRKAAPQPGATVEFDSKPRLVGGVFASIKERIGRRSKKVPKTRGTLREGQCEPLSQPSEGLTVGRANRANKAARHIAEMLEAIPTLSEEQELSADDDEVICLQKLEERFKETLRRIENDCRMNVEKVYSYNGPRPREDDVANLSADLFSKVIRLRSGLRRGRFTQRFGGRPRRCGLIPNQNLGFVLIERARHHHMLIARGPSACRDEPDLRHEANPEVQAIAPLTKKRKNRLMKLFKRLQKNAIGSKSRVEEAKEKLAERLTDILKEDAQNTKADPS